MASYNHITLLGNVGTIDVRTFDNGGKVAKVANVSLATSKRWKDRDGNPHEDTQWHRLTIGGSSADIAVRYVHKGDPLFVEGELTYRTYTNRDGLEVTSAEIRVASFQLLSRKGDAAPAPAPRAAQSLEPQEQDLPF